MATTADEERRFYDEIYARHLDLPDHALVMNRGVMRRTLNDPCQPAFERRRLYLRVLDRLLEERLAGYEVLDYGCGPGDWGVLMAIEGACATLLDLSQAAIELGLRKAKASGVADRVRGFARDASDLSCFRDGEFDLIFASAALHHTLKYPRAFSELVRVLKPGGKLMLAETYGNNPILNAARRARARLAKEPAEQGEEILIGSREIELLRQQFGTVHIEPLNLLAMAKRLFRGRFTNPLVWATVRGLEAADSVLLRAFPALQRYCGEVIIVGTR